MFSLRDAVLSFELSNGNAMALAYGQVNDQKVVSGDQSSSRVPVKTGVGWSALRPMLAKARHGQRGQDSADPK
jgi:hypothetical protein